MTHNLLLKNHESFILRDIKPQKLKRRIKIPKPQRDHQSYVDASADKQIFLHSENLLKFPVHKISCVPLKYIRFQSVTISATGKFNPTKYPQEIVSVILPPHRSPIPPPP